MTHHDDVLGALVQVSAREAARWTGVVSPTVEISYAWFRRLGHVAADFWDNHRSVELPLADEHADSVFALVSAVTEGLTPHQLWTVFADLGAYSEDSIPSHFANSHTFDQVARYTLNNIGTRFVCHLLAYLHTRVIQPHNTFDGLTAPDDGAE